MTIAPSWSTITCAQTAGIVESKTFYGQVIKLMARQQAIIHHESATRGTGGSRQIFCFQTSRFCFASVGNRFRATIPLVYLVESLCRCAKVTQEYFPVLTLSRWVGATRTCNRQF